MIQPVATLEQRENASRQAALLVVGLHVTSVIVASELASASFNHAVFYKDSTDKTD